MVAEKIRGRARCSSLALLSDAAHMLTDAAALAFALVAARLAARPARGAMTFGLGRREILSARAQRDDTPGAGRWWIVYGAIRHLISPLERGGRTGVLVVALVGIAVNLRRSAHPRRPRHMGMRMRNPGTPRRRSRQRARPRRAAASTSRSSYQHILTDLFGFIATAAGAVVILTTGFQRADAIASLLIAAVMLHARPRLIGHVRAGDDG